jgi:hypothetical protein
LPGSAYDDADFERSANRCRITHLNDDDSLEAFIELVEFVRATVSGPGDR